MTDVVNVKGVGKKTAEKLGSANIDTAEKLASASVEDVIALGIGKGTAAKIIKNAQEITAPAPVEEVVETTEKVVEKVKKPAKSKEVVKEEKVTIPEEPAEVIETPAEVFETSEEVVEVAEKPAKKPKKKAKKTKPKRVIPEDYDEPTYSRKKKVAQVKKVDKKAEILSENEVETRSTWVVNAKELTQEEKEKKAARKQIRSMADQITREIPTAPQAVKAVKTGKKKTKSEKPIKKDKASKATKTFEKQVKETVEYYSTEDIKRGERTFKVRGKSGKTGTSKPRSVIEKGTAMGFVSSHRRSRRDINNSQLIVQLNPEFDSEAVIGKTISFTYPDNGAVIVGNIYKRFGKRSSKKVLVKFEKGIRPISRYQVIYAK